MLKRLRSSAHFLLASLLCATTALSVFYLSGLITTIGSSLEIPFILAGFITGSVVMPVTSYLAFSRSRLRTAITSLSVPLSFAAIYSTLLFSKLVGNYEMLGLAFLSVAGDLFVVSVFSLREESSITSAIGIGLGGLFIMTVMLIIYAALFDSHMPLIILSGDMLAALMLLSAAALGMQKGAGAT